MVKGKKGKKGKKKATKTYSISKGVGWGMWGNRVYKTAKQFKGTDRFATQTATVASGVRIGTDDPIDTGLLIKTWKEPVLGTIASKVLPNIPIIKTLPKSIPFIGKYLKW